MMLSKLKEIEIQALEFPVNDRAALAEHLLPLPATKSKDYKLLIMLIVFSMFIDCAPKPVKFKKLIYPQGLSPARHELRYKRLGV